MNYFFLFSFLFSALAACQHKASVSTSENEILMIQPESFSPLPHKCNESSGLEYYNGMLYTMNDSGGEDKVYVINQKGKEEYSIKIKDAKNEDWEDIAFFEDELFIGDFGNNRGNRENLKVYRTKEIEKDNADSKTIKFEYGLQTNFKNQNHSNSFDCEAMIALEDELILFSKDWLNQELQVYHLAKNYKEKQVLYPTEKMDVGILITGADYDEASKQLVISGYMNWVNYIWVFKNATSKRLLSKTNQQIELIGLNNAQVEGVTFLDSNTVLISTEKTDAFNQQVWEVDIQNVFN